VRKCAAEQNRITVGTRPGDSGCAQRCTRAADVLHDHLPQERFDLLRPRPTQRIVSPSGGKGYDQTDRPIRIGLSRRRAGNNSRRNGASYELKNMPARCCMGSPRLRLVKQGSPRAVCQIVKGYVSVRQFSHSPGHSRPKRAARTMSGLPPIFSAALDKAVRRHPVCSHIRILPRHL